MSSSIEGCCQFFSIVGYCCSCYCCYLTIIAILPTTITSSDRRSQGVNGKCEAPLHSFTQIHTGCASSKTYTRQLSLTDDLSEDCEDERREEKAKARGQFIVCNSQNAIFFLHILELTCNQISLLTQFFRITFFPSLF